MMMCFKVYNGPIPGRALGEEGVLFSFFFFFSKYFLTKLAVNAFCNGLIFFLVAPLKSQ